MADHLSCGLAARAALEQDHGKKRNAGTVMRANSKVKEDRNRLPTSAASGPHSEAEPHHILLCQIGQSGEWVESVARALAAHEFPTRLAVQKITVNDPARLSSLVADTCPHLIFLAFLPSEWRSASAVAPILSGTAARPPVIAITDFSSAGELESLLRLGVDDYLLTPLRPADVICRTSHWLGLAPRAQGVGAELRQMLGLKGLVGESPVLVAQLEKLPRYARTDACVLILGETGTGKELCARAVHHLSPRLAAPFVAVNTGAIPLELIENELFGHDAGAYTSAQGPQRGLIAAAEGGTLFLDEIDSLPLSAQVKLLRFLQEKEYRPLGAKRNLSANVRVIAASNANLHDAAAEGRFRKDLYYRINVLPLRLPPLMERREDIPALARHFIAKHWAGGEKSPPKLGPTAILKLQRHDWPGNVRELENVVERALALCEAEVLRASDIDLPEEVATENTSAEATTFRAAKARLVGRFEREYLHDVLERNQGNISQAARAAGKNRRAFFALMQKHKVTVRVREQL